MYGDVHLVKCDHHESVVTQLNQMIAFRLSDETLNVNFLRNLPVLKRYTSNKQTHVQFVKF